MSDAEAAAPADFPAAPLFSLTDNHLIKPSVAGWQPSPLDPFRSQDPSILPP